VRRSSYMRVWSRGLGRVELAADLKKVKVIADGKTLYIVGRTEPPVSWDFVVRLDVCELWPVIRLMVNKQGGKLFNEYLKLKLFNSNELKEGYKEAVKTRSGIKPDEEYASILIRAKESARSGS